MACRSLCFRLRFFAYISLNSWSNNLKEGWTWRDHRCVREDDFFGHPYTGAGYVHDHAGPTATTIGNAVFPSSLLARRNGNIFSKTINPRMRILSIPRSMGVLWAKWDTVLHRMCWTILDAVGTGSGVNWSPALISPSRFFGKGD